MYVTYLSRGLGTVCRTLLPTPVRSFLPCQRCVPPRLYVIGTSRGKTGKSMLLLDRITHLPTYLALCSSIFTAQVTSVSLSN